MTKFVVKININYAIRCLKNNNGSILPEDVIIDGIPCKTKEEAITALEEAKKEGLTAL